MRISTVIPSYNRCDLIVETLRSVLSQTRPASEVIVVDDGSVDGTPDLIREQFGNDVMLVCQKNAGAGAARNAGLAHAAGDIIHFQDSDDISSLNTYEVQARAIEQGADMVYGPWVKAFFHGSDLELEDVVIQAGPIGSDGNLHLAVLRGAWLTVFQPCLFRRSLLEAAGPYRRDLAPTEDWELLYRITRLRPNMAHTPESLLLYRSHPENQISLKDPERRVIDRANLWTLFADHMARDGAGHPFSRFLFDLKRYEVAKQVAGVDPAKAAPLLYGLTGVHRQAQPWDHLFNRVRVKMTKRLFGHGYPCRFRAGALTAGQRVLLKQLGYDVRDGTA
ncbi:MAG: glycosyltransferase [Alteraurantiacibacter sp.]